jgi:hypothetical protein
MKFYEVIARPTLLYGSETWTTTKWDVNRLEEAEMRFLRSVTGYTKLDKIKSEIIRKDLEISGIQDVSSKHKQDWINPLRWMDDTRLPKHALNYKLRRRTRSWTSQKTMAMHRRRNRSNDLIHGRWWSGNNTVHLVDWVLWVDYRQHMKWTQNKRKTCIFTFLLVVVSILFIQSKH